MKLSTILLVIAAAAPLAGGDWPMWRCNAGRTATCPETLSPKLHLNWIRKLRPQDPAWKDQRSMMFDRSYHLLVMGELMFVGSTLNNTVRAYDTETGREEWRFYCGGPVRVALAAYRGRVYVASDDGCLTCLRASDGRQEWRFRCGPSGRLLIGNQRPISTWPARGGPAVADGNVYFAAGVWPIMGTFIYALDAESGRVRWINDSTSFTFRRMPHYGSAAFSGLSPQGHLVAAGDKLIVPGSRYRPAVFDRSTGKFLCCGKGLGPRVAAQNGFAFAGGRMFDAGTGNPVRLEGARRFPGLGPLLRPDQAS